MPPVPEELNITAAEYRELAQKEKPAPPLLRNSLTAFISGGAICVLGQAIQNGFIALGLKPEEAANPTVAAVILLASLLTGLGVFDRLAHLTGAGTAIPVTGFANSVTSAALEFKKEGLVLGIGSRMVARAGTVILFGVITAFIVGLISAIF